MLRSVTNPAQHGARRRWLPALGAGALLIGAVGYVGLVDPHKPHSIFPICPFRLLTGWNCPACGGLRMVHDVLHGHLTAAISDNVFLLVGIPVLAGWILLRRRSGKSLMSLPAATTVVIATLAWTVVRNLPDFPLVPTLLTS
jgi:hypothetical protein